eukprot:CAMPEP_0198720670 /NCGR_PEP_ID=MMETSP1471-20131121/63397_1 /TAXON_ID=41880 /ORGANISM="Pycnococcus provasolii, Strain RCC733" /LENGTH=135 /DNA_ID=CAMNT_0044481527 /DNA_START=223 /DNA_END=630 /DNA_ORIENTATION=+
MCNAPRLLAQRNAANVQLANLVNVSKRQLAFVAQANAILKNAWHVERAGAAHILHIHRAVQQLRMLDGTRASRAAGGTSARVNDCRTVGGCKYVCRALRAECPELQRLCAKRHCLEVAQRDAGKVGTGGGGGRFG